MEATQSNTQAIQEVQENQPKFYLVKFCETNGIYQCDIVCLLTLHPGQLLHRKLDALVRGWYSNLDDDVFDFDDEKEDVDDEDDGDGKKISPDVEDVDIPDVHDIKERSFDGGQVRFDIHKYEEISQELYKQLAGYSMFKTFSQ